MEIIKTINTDGTCKIEITSGNYSRDEQTIEKICDAARDIVSGNADRIKTANETLTDLLWQSTEKLAEAKQKIAVLKETIEFDNMQIAHYDNDLKQAESLLKTVIGCPNNTAIKEFLNRNKEVVPNDENTSDTD